MQAHHTFVLCLETNQLAEACRLVFFPSFIPLHIVEVCDGQGPLQWAELRVVNLAATKLGKRARVINALHRTWGAIALHLQILCPKRGNGALITILGIP